MEYEMTQEQLDKIIAACRTAPLVALQCGMPASPQESANMAWEALGKEMGFDYMTVRPSRSGGDRFFTADPTASR